MSAHGRPSWLRMLWVIAVKAETRPSFSPLVLLMLLVEVERRDEGLAAMFAPLGKSIAKRFFAERRDDDDLLLLVLGWRLLQGL